MFIIITIQLPNSYPRHCTKYTISQINKIQKSENAFRIFFTHTKNKYIQGKFFKRNATYFFQNHQENKIIMLYNQKNQPYKHKDIVLKKKKKLYKIHFVAIIITFNKSIL